MMNCHQHDYIELVCTYRFPVRLTLKSGETVTGIATDTCRNPHKQHCIKLMPDTSNKQDSAKQTSTLVVLDNIASMHVCIDNPHIRDIKFD